MEDGPEKQATVDRMVEIARRDSPWLWGYNPYSVGSYQPWMKNGVPTYMVRNTLEFRRIDPAMRARLVREWNPPHFWPLWLIVLRVAREPVAGVARVQGARADERARRAGAAGPRDVKAA